MLRQPLDRPRDRALTHPGGSLLRHLGLSGVSVAQLDQARAIAPVVTMQNLYNLANRADDAMVDRCAAREHRPRRVLPARRIQPPAIPAPADVAERLGASRQQVALAWLLRRSPTMALIQGTSSVAHLRENVAAADLVLPDDTAAELDALG